MAELLEGDLALPALGANSEVGEEFPLYLQWPGTAWSSMTSPVSAAFVALTDRRTCFHTALVIREYRSIVCAHHRQVS